MHQMEATRSFRFANREVETGDKIMATPREAETLRALQWAKPVDGEPQGAPASPSTQLAPLRTRKPRQPRDPSKPKRAYRRRDMRAET